MSKKPDDLLQFENQLIRECRFSKDRFHKVRNDQWKDVYQKISQKYADKTRTWKNGLHWANTDGYSPKSMKDFVGCFSVEHATWFHLLPQIIPDEHMVYFLIDIGDHSWHLGEAFWIFESCIPELVGALDLLNDTAFLSRGWPDYYIVSKKYQWIIGFNHHDVVSCVGERLDTQWLKC